MGPPRRMSSHGNCHCRRALVVWEVRDHIDIPIAEPEEETVQASTDALHGLRHRRSAGSPALRSPNPLDPRRRKRSLDQELGHCVHPQRLGVLATLPFGGGESNRARAGPPSLGSQAERGVPFPRTDRADPILRVGAVAEFSFPHPEALPAGRTLPLPRTGPTVPEAADARLATSGGPILPLGIKRGCRRPSRRAVPPAQSPAWPATTRCWCLHRRRALTRRAAAGERMRSSGILSSPMPFRCSDTCQRLLQATSWSWSPPWRAMMVVPPVVRSVSSRFVSGWVGLARV